VAGKHVYCEWPLARDTPEAHVLAALSAARPDRIHLAGLQGRFSPELRTAAEMVATGRIGRPLTANVRVFLSHGLVPRPAHRAHLRHAAVGATVLSIQGGHVLDMVQRVLGPATVGSTRIWPAVPEFVIDTGERLPRDAPDNAISAATASLNVVGEAGQQVVHVGAVVATQPEGQHLGEVAPRQAFAEQAPDIVGGRAPLEQWYELPDVLVLLVSTGGLVAEDLLDEAAVQVGRDQPGLFLDCGGGVVPPDNREHEDELMVQAIDGVEEHRGHTVGAMRSERGGEQGAVMPRQFEQPLDELVEAVLAVEGQPVAVAFNHICRLRRSPVDRVKTLRVRRNALSVPL
jgi:hypothetical protein